MATRSLLFGFFAYCYEVIAYEIDTTESAIADDLYVLIFFGRAEVGFHYLWERTGLMI